MSSQLRRLAEVFRNARPDDHPYDRTMVPATRYTDAEQAEVDRVVPAFLNAVGDMIVLAMQTEGHLTMPLTMLEGCVAFVRSAWDDDFPNVEPVVADPAEIASLVANVPEGTEGIEDLMGIIADMLADNGDTAPDAEGKDEEGAE